MKRWKAEGFVVVRKFIRGQPHWVWLTSRGLHHMGLPYSYREPSLSKLNHHHAVNGVRLVLEQKWGKDVSWRSERALNLEQGRQVYADDAPAHLHVPDAEILYKQYEDPLAIEVELSQKRRRRLNAILAQLRVNYTGVYYIVAENCYEWVESAVEEIEAAAERRTFTVHPLSAYSP